MKFKLKVKKSQTAIEFVVLVALALFFFTGFFLAIQANMSEKIRQRQDLVIKDIAIAVQDEINLASQSIDGYSRKFEIPEKAGTRDYEINITEGLVYIRTTDGRNAMALPVTDVTGDVKKGTNVIKKENGEIKLNP